MNGSGSQEDRKPPCGVASFRTKILRHVCPGSQRLSQRKGKINKWQSAVCAKTDVTLLLFIYNKWTNFVCVTVCLISFWKTMDIYLFLMYVLYCISACTWLFMSIWNSHLAASSYRNNIKCLKKPLKPQKKVRSAKGWGFLLISRTFWSSCFPSQGSIVTMKCFGLKDTTDCSVGYYLTWITPLYITLHLFIKALEQ